MSRESTSFLTLPLELREFIYEEVLSHSSCRPHLLQACREIYSEAQKFLYQRPIFFSSQSDLNQWIRDKPKEMLKNVHDFRLELQDVDFAPVLLSTCSEDQLDRSRSLRTWELYENELKNLDRSFKTLSNVRVVAIRALAGRQTHLYNDFLAKVLQMLGYHFSAMRELILEGNTHNQSMDFLQSIKSLASLSFDGFSASDPAELAATLSKVNVTRISIISQPTLLTPQQYRHSSFTMKSQSFGTSVLRTTKQLTSFLVAEAASTPITGGLYFNSDLLNSLQNHGTLSSLSLRLSYTPDEDVLDNLNDYLRNSRSIERLEIDWPHLESSVSYVMADRLKSLWLRVSDMKAALGILKTILESKGDGDMQKLCEVILIRKAWNATCSDGERSDNKTGEATISEVVGYTAPQRTYFANSVYNRTKALSLTMTPVKRKEKTSRMYRWACRSSKCGFSGIRSYVGGNNCNQCACIYLGFQIVSA